MHKFKIFQLHDESLSMELLILTLVLLLIGSITAHYAVQRGRSPVYWFTLGALFGIMGLLLLFLLPDLANQKDKKTNIVQSSVQSHIANDYKGKKWYYLDDAHAQQGPMDFERLIPAWNDQLISSKTFVWSEGMSDWKTIEELHQFKEALKG